MNLIVNVSRSSHPEFVYFAEVSHQGRQMAGRFNTRAEVAEWVQKLRDAGKERQITFTVNDETSANEFGEL